MEERQCNFDRATSLESVFSSLNGVTNNCHGLVSVVKKVTVIFMVTFNVTEIKS